MSAFAREPIGEDQAIELIKSYVSKQAGHSNLDCRYFFVEEVRPDSIEIAIREKHGDTCGGDPEVSPIVDRFKVKRTSQEIDKYDPLEDEYLPVKGK